jgi:ABC-type branched-subunit amino acid transport system substrate-binding protein/outer membrane protein assembly factor BamD (BamD/ComL family)
MSPMANMRMFGFLIAVLVLVPESKCENVQDSIVFRGDVEREFVEAMKLYTSQRYDSAAAMFSKILKENPRSHRATATLIMGGKSYYRIGNYRESIKLLKDLLDIYNESQYVLDARYTLGLDYFRLARYEDAAQQFLTVRQRSLDPKLIPRSEKMLETIAISQLTVAQMQLLLGEATLDPTKAILSYAMAEKVFRTGDVKGAQEILRSITMLPPNTKYVADALALLSKIEKGGVLKVGVALPLLLKTASATLKPAVEVLEGVRIAADEYNLDALPKVNLEIRDTESDPSIAARGVTDLCSDDKVIAVLGPMFSDEVFAAAGVANARGVPLLTPTATRNGIAAMGPYIFQANPDYDTRGRAMARYAYEQRGARRFGVLAPKGAVGELLADSFIDEVKKLGGELVDVQWYFAGSTDMRSQLMAIRKKALERVEVTIVDFAAKMKQSALNKMQKWGVPSQVMDSLIERNASTPVTFLFGPNGKQIADSLGVPTVLVPIKYDSLAVPVVNIDAMFVPISTSDEIGVVASQAKYYNFQTLLLGTEDWNELSELDENRQYADGVVFLSDTYTNVESPAYKIFESKFQKAYNKKPVKNSLFGYDAMRMLLQTIKKGATNRNELASALPNVRNFYGLHSTISFKENRVNSFLTVLQFKNRAIRKIGEIDLSSPMQLPPGL